jgi:hypothetical protein
MAAFDHIAVSAETLEAGVAHVEEILGVSLEAGGKHPHMGTHNRVLSLGPSEYLEVIAIDPDATKPAHPRWFALDDFAGAPRLTNWIVRVDDLDAALSGAPNGAGKPTDLARGDFRWRFAVPKNGYLPYDNAFPALIEWQSAHPADRLTDTGCRLVRLEIAHPEASALGAVLPLSDPRIAVVPGAKEMRATIATPHGERVLT